MRTSDRLGLLFPYDWSNPEVPDDWVVERVLERQIFQDVVQVCLVLGIDHVRRVAQEMPDEITGYGRFWTVLDNIERGFANAKATISSEQDKGGIRTTKES
ncbi:hypothetical protein MnBA_38840 [Marinobacterium sp. BA1]